MSGLRAAIDIGGTFTDLMVIDANGRTRVDKVLTTSDDPGRAIESLVSSLFDGAADDGNSTVLHATTLVTNALLERKGARTALLTTEGFRDAIEIGREHRFELYDLLLELPAPLVPRHLRFDVPERITTDGEVLTPLDEDHVARLASELSTAGIQAIAVCYLNSFRNPRHEQRTAEIVRKHFEGAVVLSSDIAPEMREYPRGSTTVASAYVRARVEQYLANVEERLRCVGFKGRFFVMLSSGGLAHPSAAVSHPIRLLESGPAAGALGAAYLSARAGFKDVLSFDMGGTTAKLCAIEDGQPLRAAEFEVGRVYRFLRGSGLPVIAPVVDMVELGAGGGSIARIDALGLLKVGPDSSGADPGPACYARGGDQPTVTDADLVLGYIDANSFLGGAMRLDRDRALAALAPIARGLSLDVPQAASGVHRLVNEAMASAAQAHLADRGLDPRRMPLFAFGGAGPVHAWGVARILRSPLIISPLHAGVGSCLGLLVAAPSFEFSRTAPGRLDALDWPAMNGVLDELAEEGRRMLAAANVAPSSMIVRRWADMRYSGQGHVIPVPLPEGPLSERHRDDIAAAFAEVYRSLYKRLGPAVPLEISHWRVNVSSPSPEFPAAERVERAGARRAARQVYFAEAGGFVSTPVYDRDSLRPGETLDGPAVIEERESTFVIGPRSKARVDEQGNVLVELFYD